MKLRNRKPLLGLVLTVAIIMGTIVGAGLAYASDVPHDLSSGTQGYTGYHSDYYAGYNISDSYNNYEYINRSADSTFVHTYNIHKYSGSVSPVAAQDNVVLAYGYIYDEYGNHSVYYSMFASVLIHNCNVYGYPNWEYSSLNSNNNYVISEQHIWYYDPGSGYTSLGVDYDTYYTGIGSR
jgi:hypothetical protein